MTRIHILAILSLINITLWGQEDLKDLTLEKYRPQSIFNVPVSEPDRGKFRIIDMHSHPYAISNEEISAWVKTMDDKGIDKTIILTFETGVGFDSLYAKYSAYPDRFDLWCGFDFTGYDNDPDWIDHAIAELERCHEKGAKGVGELGDKGEGLLYSKPVPAYGLHIDDLSLQPLLKRCGELGMPISIHVAEPYWMYEKMDSTNDGLMNGYYWRIDLSKEGILDHGELITSLENAVKNNPNTTFIACHFANYSYDLSIIGNLLDKYPNLYADISARYAETATVPRYTSTFYDTYQDRLLYGTDMGFNPEMYNITFRILESTDEHFYETDQFSYHWPLYGLGLSDDILKKLYRENALKLLKE